MTNTAEADTTATPDPASPAITDAYLIETSYDVTMPHEVRLVTLEDLTTFLSDSIDDAHYSGEAERLCGIWRYNAGGQLTELVLKFVRQTEDDNDYSYLYYEIREAAPKRPVTRDPDEYLSWDDTPNPAAAALATFSVTIDGRA
jgi:hypothetical protein